jgi:hypothetical protein
VRCEAFCSSAAEKRDYAAFHHRRQAIFIALRCESFALAGLPVARILVFDPGFPMAGAVRHCRGSLPGAEQGRNHTRKFRMCGLAVAMMVQVKTCDASFIEIASDRFIAFG